MAKKPGSVYFCLQSGAFRSGLIDMETHFLDLKELHYFKDYQSSNPDQTLGRDELRETTIFFLRKFQGVDIPESGNWKHIGEFWYPFST